jgi:hypothetical protein
MMIWTLKEKLLLQLLQLVLLLAPCREPHCLLQHKQQVVALLGLPAQQASTSSQQQDQHHLC